MSFFLDNIHKEFNFLIKSYGFKIFKELDNANSNTYLVWYIQRNRFIGVSYEGNKDAEISISIGEIFLDGKWGETFDLIDLLEEKSKNVKHYYGVREPETILGEIKHLKNLLTEYCSDFLKGDLSIIRETGDD